jgi:hypothetical protein
MEVKQPRSDKVTRRSNGKQGLLNMFYHEQSHDILTLKREQHASGKQKPLEGVKHVSNGLLLFPLNSTSDIRKCSDIAARSGERCVLVEIA